MWGSSAKEDLPKSSLVSAWDGTQFEQTPSGRSVFLFSPPTVLLKTDTLNNPPVKQKMRRFVTRMANALPKVSKTSNDSLLLETLRNLRVSLQVDLRGRCAVSKIADLDLERLGCFAELHQSRLQISPRLCSVSQATAKALDCHRELDTPPPLRP